MPLPRSLALLSLAAVLVSGAACQRTPDPPPARSLACIWAMPPQAGGTAVSIEGLVLSGEGTPLEGVTLTVGRRDGAGTTMETRSDGRGRFSLTVALNTAPVCLHARLGDALSLESGDLPADRPATLHGLIVLTGSKAPPVAILTDDRDRPLLSASPSP